MNINTSPYPPNTSNPVNYRPQSRKQELDQALESMAEDLINRLDLNTRRPDLVPLIKTDIARLNEFQFSIDAAKTQLRGHFDQLLEGLRASNGDSDKISRAMLEFNMNRNAVTGLMVFNESPEIDKFLYALGHESDLLFHENRHFLREFGYWIPEEKPVYVEDTKEILESILRRFHPDLKLNSEPTKGILLELLRTFKALNHDNTSFIFNELV